MSFKLLGGGSDLSTVISDVNQNILELKGREVTEIFKDDTGTRRVLLGKGQSGFYGLKVSKEGFDVYAAENDDLIFNSDQNIFKIVQTGTLETGPNSVATGSAGQFLQNFVNVEATHNLGYIPAVIAYMVVGDGSSTQYMAMPLTVFSGGGGGTQAQWQRINIRTDETKIYVTYHVMVYGGGGFTDDDGYTIKYYLLQETAAA